jgi:hypothetical protein
MIKKLLYLLEVFLLLGSVVAWKQVLTEFAQFYALEGTLFKLQNCIVPNPVTTPCFWGAIAFVVGLVWVAVLILRSREGKSFKVKALWIFMLACTIFAVSNFSYQLWLYYYRPGSGGQCFVGSGPWGSACFYGSVLFLLSFVTTSFIKFYKSRAD